MEWYPSPVVSRCIKRDNRHNAERITETRRSGPVFSRLGKVARTYLPTCLPACLPAWHAARIAVTPPCVRPACVVINYTVYYGPISAHPPPSANLCMYTLNATDVSREFMVAPIPRLRVTYLRKRNVYYTNGFLVFHVRLLRSMKSDCRWNIMIIFLNYFFHNYAKSEEYLCNFHFCNIYWTWITRDHSWISGSK